MKCLFIWVLSLFVPTIVPAQSLQSALNVAGGSFKKDHLVLEWSIGELAAISTVNAVDGSATITQGFLQPIMLSPSNGTGFESYEVKILPNPTFGKIEVNLLTLSKGRVHISIYDAQGKWIMGRQTTSYGIGNIENFDITRYAAGNYFIRIELKPEPGSQARLGTYKIIKL